MLLLRTLTGCCVLLLLLFSRTFLLAQSPDPYIHHGGVLIHMSVMQEANLSATGWTEDQVKNGAETCRKVVAALQYPDLKRSVMMARPWLDSLFFQTGSEPVWTAGRGYDATFDALRQRVTRLNGPVTIMRVKAEKGSDDLLRCRFYLKGPDMKCPPADTTPSISAEAGNPWSMVVAIRPNGRMKIEKVLGDLSL